MVYEGSEALINLPATQAWVIWTIDLGESQVYRYSHQSIIGGSIPTTNVGEPSVARVSLQNVAVQSKISASAYHSRRATSSSELTEDCLS